MSDDVHRKGEKFLELFNKGKEFTEELLKENQRLRFRLAAVENASGSSAPGDAEIQRLSDQLQKLNDENRQIHERFRVVEDENKDFASRYIEIEEQNNNLANLYVASYQLHSTLDFREVIQIVQEIVINLIGSEAFAILLLDEKTNELKTIAYEGGELVPGIDKLSTRVGEGDAGHGGQNRPELLHQSGLRWKPGFARSTPGSDSAEDQGACNRSDRDLPAAPAEGFVFGGRFRAVFASGRPRRDGNFRLQALFAV